MAKITLDIPEENIPYLLQVTGALGLDNNNIILKDESPSWHAQVLNERLERYQSGETKATSWDDFEKELENNGE